MEDERRAIIITEIKYWKEHKLLPEQYCDYLLALYTEGEDESKVLAQNRKRISILERFQIVLLYSLLPLAFIVIYFTEFQNHLQLIILGIFLSYSGWLSINYKDHTNRIYFHSAFIISLFLFLLLCIMLTEVIFVHQSILMFVIASNFIFWVLLGYVFKYKYLMLIGFLCLLFQFIYYFL